MNGVTNAPFRYITDLYGKPDIIYTEFFPESDFSIMRKHLAWYVKDFPHAAEVRNQLMQVNNIDNVKKIIGEVD